MKLTKKQIIALILENITPEKSAAYKERLEKNINVWMAFDDAKIKDKERNEYTDDDLFLPVNAENNFFDINDYESWPQILKDELPNPDPTNVQRIKDKLHGNNFDMLKTFGSSGYQVVYGTLEIMRDLYPQVEALKSNDFDHKLEVVLTQKVGDYLSRETIFDPEYSEDLSSRTSDLIGRRRKIRSEHSKMAFCYKYLVLLADVLLRTAPIQKVIVLGDFDNNDEYRDKYVFYSKAIIDNLKSINKNTKKSIYQNLANVAFNDPDRAVLILNIINGCREIATPGKGKWRQNAWIPETLSLHASHGHFAKIEYDGQNAIRLGLHARSIPWNDEKYNSFYPLRFAQKMQPFKTETNLEYPPVFFGGSSSSFNLGGLNELDSYIEDLGVEAPTRNNLNTLKSLFIEYFNYLLNDSDCCSKSPNKGLSYLLTSINSISIEDNVAINENKIRRLIKEVLMRYK